MTWAELEIRAYAYRRLRDELDMREDLRAREIAWASLVGFHSDPKKLPKSKERFWLIGERKSITNDKMKKAIREAQKQYLIDKQNAENGN